MTATASITAASENDTPSTPAVIGVIGACLLMRLPGLHPMKAIQVSTCHGLVNLKYGRYGNIRVVFCHRPTVDTSLEYSKLSNIPLKAVCAAMKILRCEWVIGVYSVASLKKGMKKGSLVIPHDFCNPFDASCTTQDTPEDAIPKINEAVVSTVCAILSKRDIAFLDSSVYIQSPGPRFETKSVIDCLSTFGDVIGTTGGYDCQRFSEFKIPFMMLAMIDSYACPGSGEVADVQDEHYFQTSENLCSAVTAILSHLSGALQSLGDMVMFSRTQVDLIINAKHVIPVEPIGEVLNEHAIVVNEGKIIAILPWRDAHEKYTCLETEDLRDHALIPGLVNCHNHASMALFRGLADDKRLHEWLSQDIWPAEAQFVCPEFIVNGTEHAVAEMIRGGTTCYCDMYYFPQSSAEVLERVGMRGVLGQIMIDFPSVYGRGPDDYFAKCEENLEKYNGSHMVRYSVSPHSPYTVSDKSLLRVKEISAKWNVPIHIHLHESKEECNDSENLVTQSMSCHKSDQKCRPLENFARMGLLSEKLVAVHMTELTREEIKLITDAKVNVVHCPSSNLKLANGFCPISDLLGAGVNVAIGTDGAASNNTLDMFAEMKLAALLDKGRSKNCTSIPAATALRMATLHGARALGLGDEIGSISVGKVASAYCHNDIFNRLNAC